MNRMRAISGARDPFRFIDLRLAVEHAGQPDIAFLRDDGDVRLFE